MFCDIFVAMIHNEKFRQELELKINAALTKLKKARANYYNSVKEQDKLEAMLFIRDVVLNIQNEIDGVSRKDFRYIQGVIKSFYTKYKIMELLDECEGFEARVYQLKLETAEAKIKKLINRNVIQRIIRKHE